MRGRASASLVSTRGMSLDERLGQYTPEPNSGCWLWLGGLTTSGYGYTGHRSSSVAAHRLSYEKHRGPIPEGLVLDHKCRVRSCINPDHLEPVTSAENYRRGKLHRQYKPHCSRGHLYTAETTWVDEWGRRQCRVCWRLIRDRDRARAKARARSPHKELIRRVRTVADRMLETVEAIIGFHAPTMERAGGKKFTKRTEDVRD
jgi:hypothetical protein